MESRRALPFLASRLPQQQRSHAPHKRHTGRNKIGRPKRASGIGDRASHLPGALSGGQQQRVSIARALSNKPAMLFADEPTGNLDGKSGREVLALMRYVGKELGVTLVLVTHDLSVAEQADRILTLSDGRVASDSREAQS